MLEPSRVALSVQRGHLDLARGDEKAARARLARVNALAHATSDVRLASTTLRAALERLSVRRLDVAEDATWFRLGGRDEPVARRLLRQLLRALVVARVEHPGRALGVDDVCRAMWPGERIMPKAARRRVQVAISTLRAMGLRDVLRTEASGYMLDPSVELDLVAKIKSSP